MTVSTSATSAAAEPISPAAAIPVLQRHGQHSSAFLALNDGNRYFAADGVEGMVVYRPFGRRYWVQFTGPVAPAAGLDRLTDAFAAEAARRRRRVIAVQLPRADAERVVDRGWVVGQFGCSYSIDLTNFGLSGRKFVKTRNMITRSRREGVAVAEVGADRMADPEFAAGLDAIDGAWLRSKGRHVKEMRFLIGQRGGALQGHRRLFAATVAGRPVAYISYSPVYGESSGWLYDLTRRAPDAPPGVIEHIFAEAAEQLRAEGAGWMHLGLTPFIGLEEQYALDGGRSAVLSRLLGLIEKHGSALYPARSQLAFKLKWRPQVITPEYVAFPRRVRLRDAWCLARITNSL
jgi:lysylphosphatidylglycerol synthetase-like protein (DUF2156 family)